MNLLSLSRAKETQKFPYLPSQFLSKVAPVLNQILPRRKGITPGLPYPNPHSPTGAKEGPMKIMGLITEQYWDSLGKEV